MNARIEEITIRDVRGIADALTINLVKRPNGKAGSLMLLGENGAGKSSVADALEFVTRGTVSRRSAGGVKLRRELRNLHRASSNPMVEAQFSDNRRFIRGAGPTNNMIRPKPGEPIPGFERCPVVVRRRDIEEFWTVPEKERQAFFFDYLRESGGAYLNEAQRNEKIDAYHAALVEEENAIQKLLPFLTMWEGEIPAHDKGLQGLRSHLTHSFGQRLNGKKRILPPDVHEAFEEFSKALNRRKAAAAAGKEAEEQESIDRTELRSILANVSPKVASDFRKITNDRSVEEVNFAIDDQSRLQILLKTIHGGTHEPTDILSEAHLDLLALLMIIEIHIECSRLGQMKIIVLDDVFQSVDRSLRIRILDYLVDRLSGWQTLITFHDRLWVEIASRAWTSANEPHVVLELRPNSDQSSPAVIGLGVGLMRDTDLAVQAHASPALIVGAAGRALEGILEETTQSLNVMIRRQLDDRYTINDLWQPLIKELKNCGNSSDLTELLGFIDSKRFLRNQVGAHYSVSADELSVTEALDFAKIVSDLYRVLACPQCLRPRSRTSAASGQWDLQPGHGCKHKVE